MSSLAVSDEIASLLRTWKRRPLWETGPATRQVQLGQTDVRRILPHRDPFLFIDAISEIDLEQAALRAHRRVAVDDPVFVGHFPGAPVYPGVLQVEALGQAGVCLVHLLEHQTHTVSRDARPVGVRALKIHHASFLAAVLPGAHLDISVRLLDQNGFTAIWAGQLVNGGAVCCIAVVEAYFAAS